jgi:subtilisin family serine protease
MAANIGAQVINISEAACYKITRPIDESGVGAAINYAVNVKSAVVIAAAGNTGQDYDTPRSAPYCHRGRGATSAPRAIGRSG